MKDEKIDTTGGHVKGVRWKFKQKTSGGKIKVLQN